MTSLTKRKIVLFSANVKYVGPPLGLLSITRLIDRKKYEIKIVTKNEYPNYEEEVIKQCNGAVCLGISAINSYPVKTAKKISQEVKKRYPNLPIIWGGWQTTTLPEETLKADYVDYICMGQGDKMFSQFIDVITSGKLSNLKKIPRLGYKKNEKIILNERLGTEDFQSLPDFSLDLINWEKYLELTDFGEKVIRVMSSYGCPYRCAFCCEPMNSKRVWKALSASRFLNFLKKLRKKVNFDGLMIVDNNFFVDEKRVTAICKGLIKNKFKIKLGQVNGRTNNLIKYKPESWKLLRKAGLYNILTGAESGSEEILTFINKDATVKDTLKLAKICHKYKILLIISVIVGLPTEKYSINRESAFKEDLNGIIDLYNKICVYGPNHHLLIFPFAPLPFSPLYEKAITFGFKPPYGIDRWADYEFTKVRVPWIPKEGYRKISLFNDMAFIVGIDFKYLLTTVPLLIKIVAKPLIHIFRNLEKWRFKRKCLKFPIDIWLLKLCVHTFVIINRKFKMVKVVEM